MSLAVAYQLTVPEEAVAPRTTGPKPTREPGVVEVMVGAALTVTESVREVPDPHEVEGVTETVPPVVPMVTVILFVPVPAVMVHPEGTVQL